MKLAGIASLLPPQLVQVLEKENIAELRPAQEKSVRIGLLDGRNLLVCTPTASGKTLVAELAAIPAILNRHAKVVYIVPLRSLAAEKYKDFSRKYGHLCRVALAIGDIDSVDGYLADVDMIICTAEKLDSLLRHHTPWVSRIGVIVADEVHLLNDPNRGPTLEILLTMLRSIIPSAQLVALSATVGNQQELADWLHAELVTDTWRPVKLRQGIFLQGKVEFSK